MLLFKGLTLAVGADDHRDMHTLPLEAVFAVRAGTCDVAHIITPISTLRHNISVVNTIISFKITCLCDDFPAMLLWEEIL